MDSTQYEAKLARMEPGTLLTELDSRQTTFIRDLARTYRFTYQELRQVCQAARDREMWREEALSTWWQTAEEGATGQGRDRKKNLLRGLEKSQTEVAASEKVYPASGFISPPKRTVRLQEKETTHKVMGLCPAYSEETVCCGLHTLDAVRGCPFSCSYCTIQTFYGETAELEADLTDKLSAIELDPNRRYHIGTGQASDSLVWGNKGGILEALLGFASDNPNVLLELKTKSQNIRYLLEREIPPNIVCSWTMNTSTIIENEEMGAASVERRLAAARSMADHDVLVSFHFHPMVFYSGWRDDYSALVSRVLEMFSPHEISFISMGSVTMIKPVIQEIRRRGGESKILQMDLVQDHHGKLTYPDEIKLELFKTLYRAFHPWHRDVFFYLCMETAMIWRQVLGYAYPTNVQFEADFLHRCLPGSPQATAVQVSGAES